jgi:hypothetical protein
MRTCIIHEHDGHPSGYTEKDPDGTVRVTIRRRLLDRMDSSHTHFVLLHELFHVLQLLRGETEARLFSGRLYAQDFEASAFAGRRLRSARGYWRGIPYTSVPTWILMSLETAYPGPFHIVWGGGVFTATYVLFGKPLSNWVANGSLFEPRGGHRR